MSDDIGLLLAGAMAGAGLVLVFVLPSAWWLLGLAMVWLAAVPAHFFGGSR